MKTSEHVEYLLKQGKKPKELLELGFPKQVITRVRRRLRQEKAKPVGVSAKGRDAVHSGHETPVVSEKATAALESRLAAVDCELNALKERILALEEAIAEAVTSEDLENRLDGTHGIGLKNKFKCQCGASGFVALHVQCTKCGREDRWG